MTQLRERGRGQGEEKGEGERQRKRKGGVQANNFFLSYFCVWQIVS